MRKEERERGHGLSVRAVSQQDMRFISAARTIMKNMLNYFTETLTGHSAKGSERGKEGGADRGRVKVERGFIKFKINCSNVVFSCFARIANVLHVWQLGAWLAGSVARWCVGGGRGREVTGSGYATCAPLLRH